MQVNSEYFFASANSGKGFINLFGDIFSSCRHLYIIKGGSGTGKSSLMKKALNTAIQNGYRTELFLCSSDPDSLDGILIKDTGIGIIDGTAPHSADTCLPGAFDEFINTGDFWNAEKLMGKKTIIKELTESKKELYNRAYAYLNAAQTCEGISDLYLSDALNKTKMKKAVLRLYESLKLKSKGEYRVRFTEAVSMKGYISLNNYKNSTTYKITNKYNMAHHFLKEFHLLLKNNGIMHTVGLSPLDPQRINMLYIHEADLLLTTGEANEPEKIINTERFILKEINKRQIKTALKHRDVLMSEALDIMTNIKELHFELEKIYIGAMDFDAKNCHEEELLTKIFSLY
ncbi:MAG: hypothetical protein E7652_06180 [Ruminococcaceae bacterium]|nr:hypothetical protein [Oscillospiraceae bacterium]